MTSAAESFGTPPCPGITHRWTILHRIRSSTLETEPAEGTACGSRPARRWRRLSCSMVFLAAGAVGDVGNASFIGVFQVLWEGAASSRLSIGRQLP